MSGRELVILILGLAIVAVVLRGLYVAINARRGQIKLAIDKNIPQNVDLESLELAELPGGGARVVTRSLEEVNRQNSALDEAETKARSLNLTDAEEDAHIPVLMDAVELSEPAPARADTPREYQPEVAPAEDLETSDVDFAEEPVTEEMVVIAAQEQSDSIEEERNFTTHTSQEHSIGEDWEEDDAEPEDGYSETQASKEHVAHDENDADSVLFDYDEEELEAHNNVDPMSSIAPDYAEESDEAEVSSAENVETTDDDSYEEDDLDVDEQVEFSSQELEQEQEGEEEQSTPFDADSSIDEFSMTAGERIGGNPSSIDEASQSDVFDGHAAEEAVDKPKSGRSLFSLFGRKSKRREERLDDEVLASPVVDVEASVTDEPDDVLLQEEFTQLDIEDAEIAESESSESPVDEDVIDELDQKRLASIESEPEEPVRHTEEFEHSEVLVLNVTAKDGRVFSGDDLLQILITSGLKFGDMNIFHKRLAKEHQSTIIFSVANMLNPGTFDLNNMDEFTTLGISFFLALPSPINNLDAFEQMLGVAQEIRDTLGGDLKDDHRNGMTGQTIEHYRQRIRDFELRRLKAVAARG